MFGHSPLVGSHSIRFLNEFESNTIDGKQLYSMLITIHNYEELVQYNILLGIANPLVHPEASIKVITLFNHNDNYSSSDIFIGWYHSK